MLGVGQRIEASTGWSCAGDEATPLRHLQLKPAGCVTLLFTTMFAAAGFGHSSFFRHSFVIGHSSLDIRHWTFDIGHSSLDIRHWTFVIRSSELSFQNKKTASPCGLAV